MSVIPDRKRHLTAFPGVIFRWAKRANAKRGQIEKVYYCLFWRDGKKIEVRCGGQFRDDMTPARAAVLRAQYMENERDTPQERRQKRENRVTIRKLWALYDADHQKGRAPSDNKVLVGHLEPFLDMEPQELSTSGLKAFAVELGKTRSPQTVRHVMGMLRRLVRYGEASELCVIPAGLRFPQIRVDNQKTETLTQGQIDGLIKVLCADHDRNLSCLMLLALFTGARKNALLGLQWTDIDLENGFLTLRGSEAKNSKTAVIPLSAPAQEILEQIKPTDNSPYLFPGRNGGRRREVRRFTRRIAEQAGLPEGFRPFHGLRHVFASVLASNGVDLFTIQKLLTQNSPQMAQRYSHLADEALRRGSETMGKILEKK